MANNDQLWYLTTRSVQSVDFLLTDKLCVLLIIYTTDASTAYILHIKYQDTIYS